MTGSVYVFLFNNGFLSKKWPKQVGLGSCQGAF